MKQRYSSRLRQERERRGWSRNYVAEQTEVDVVTVGRWERGERMPHPVYRQQLCTLFGMTAEELGLFAEPFQELDQQATLAGISSNDLDTSHAFSVELEISPELRTTDSIETVPAVQDNTEASDISGAGEIIVHPSEQIVTEKKKLMSASLSETRSRRTFLVGLGSLGITALAGAGVLLTWQASHPTAPVRISAGKPYQQFLDQSTQNWVNRLSWSPDESSLAAATGTNTVSIWDRGRGVLVRDYHTPNLWVNDVSWSKTNWLAVCSADYHTGTLEIWNLTANKPAATFPRPHSLRTSFWSPDGDYLAFAGHSATVEVWQPFIPRQVSQYSYPALGTQGGISRVKWSAAGNLLACAADDGTVHILEALTGRVRFIYREHRGRVIDIAWSPDSKYIASASSDKTVRVWEALSGYTVCIYQGHSDQVEGIDWSFRGNLIASGGKDQTAQVWEALTGKQIVSYEKLNSTVEATLWSRDGTMIALGTNTEGIEIWKIVSP